MIYSNSGIHLARVSRSWGQWSQLSQWSRWGVLRQFGSSSRVGFSISQTMAKTVGGSSSAGSKAASKATSKAVKSHLDKLKAQLKKEKELLAATKKKYADLGKKEAAKAKAQKEKAKAKEAAVKAKLKKEEEAAKKKAQKVLEKATKPYRRLSAYNYYIKETTVGKNNLADISAAWKALPDHEREEYQRKADVFNEKQLKIFTPRPKAPPTSYASFVKENYPNDGRDFKEINKDLAAQWRSLPDHEKEKYEPSSTARQEYHAKLKAWQEDRVRAFKEQNNLA